MNSLVSVVIATYNSSQFLTETLDSVSKQTWNNIELIITDDASSDNTTEVYNKWIINNGKRFIYSEIITAQKNTGVSANVNRGLHASKGEWIVLLAGDDTLKAKCIEDNMLFINTHPEVKVLFSRIDVYRDTFDPVNHIKTIPDDPFNVDSIMAPGRSADSQYKMLLISDRITFTPSVYFHRETLLSVGGFDERFKLLEDYPIWLKLTKKGIRLNFMDKVTVNYRQHSKAINNTGISYLVNPNYFKHQEFRKIYTYPFLPIDIRLNQYFTWYTSQVFRCKWLNKNRKINSFLHSMLTLYINPFKYYIFLKKKINKSLTDNEFYT